MRVVSFLFSLAPLAGVVPAADSLHVRLIGQYDMPSYVYGVDAVGGFAYVVDTDGLHVIRVADPASPSEVGFCHIDGDARAISVAGSLAYVADDLDTMLRIISIDDPTNPVEVGSCRTRAGPVALIVRAGYVYVAVASGMEVISVADPGHPSSVGYCYMPGGIYTYTYNLDLDGDYAYVADRDGGLIVVSVADPANPVRVGYYVPGGVLAVAVRDGYAYIGGYDRMFHVLSISDPTNPVELGRYEPHDVTQDVELLRSYAFAGMWNGLRVVSIADPANPVEVGRYLRGACFSVDIDRDYAYVAAYKALVIFQFYQPGDLDIDNDSLDVMSDTLHLRDWIVGTSESLQCVQGEFILANTSPSYNPDPIDGPSVSVVDSLGFTGSLVGPGGTIDSIVIPRLPTSLAQGQTLVCTLAAYVPVGLKEGNYTGTIYISGKDTANLEVYESCYVFVSKLGDLDIDNDSLDVIADTIRLTNLGSGVIGEFILANTSESYNPDTADGPSRSPVDSLVSTGSLIGPGGTIDSILIPNLPTSLAQGQAIVCTLAAHVPPGMRDGDYAGSITITGKDSAGALIQETFSALIRNVPGDLDIDGDSLDVAHDTMNLHTQPAGPVYSPYAKARFVIVNASSSYNPDTVDGPSQSTLREVEVKAKVVAQNGAIDSVYVLNLPESLAVEQAVECTLALVIPVGEPLGGQAGWVTISAYDMLGFQVQDSFFLTVHGPQPRQNLDSLRVAPIPFKPNQNPEHDAIHFQGLTAGARVIVYDASGQSVWSETEAGDGHLAWKAEVASGIYVYLVVAKDGESKVGKLSVIR